MESTAAAVSAKTDRWFDKLPTPHTCPPSINVERLHSLIHDGAAESVIVVDVRRTDIEEDPAVMIPRAINLPAQTFFHTLSAVIPVLQRYDYAVFHCSSSRGRGPRCAGWYADALVEQGLPVNACVLAGGVKAWVSTYASEAVSVRAAAEGQGLHG